MAKVIAYLITATSYKPGQARRVVFASLSEVERDAEYKKSMDEEAMKEEMIVDWEPARRAAYEKLNGLERLLLGVKKTDKRQTTKRGGSTNVPRDEEVQERR